MSTSQSHLIKYSKSTKEFWMTLLCITFENFLISSSTIDLHNLILFLLTYFHISSSIEEEFFFFIFHPLSPLFPSSSLIHVHMTHTEKGGKNILFSYIEMCVFFLVSLWKKAICVPTSWLLLHHSNEASQPANFNEFRDCINMYSVLVLLGACIFIQCGVRWAVRREWNWARKIFQMFFYMLSFHWELHAFH